jgi:nucleoside-diphosphate-sugar epimerase
MSTLKIFITGASGCIGHYVAEALIGQTDHELYLLVRNPAKLQIDWQTRPGVHILEGNLHDLGPWESVLQTIDVAILIATAWGDPQETYAINVTQTVALVQHLATGVCQHILYFSTESILDQNNQLLPEAGKLGTDYIRTKYLCFKELEDLKITPKITALFPTLVFGGDGSKPYSHITAGLPDILQWLWLIRFFQADASFHFIHGQDIAQVVRYLIQHPEAAPPSDSRIGKVVLGNAPFSVNRAIAEICHYRNLRLFFRIPLSVWLADFFIKIFRIQMADWDRFCLHYRHFVHQNPVNPQQFGLPAQASSLPELLRTCGITPGK